MNNFTNEEKKLIQDILATDEFEEFPRENLYLVIKELSDKEERIIRLKYGLDDTHPKSLREIGEMFGVSAERIRQTISKCIKKLRHPTRRKMLFGENPFTSVETELSSITYKTKIEDCELSIRSKTCLIRHGVVTVDDLLKLSTYDMFKIKNMGKKSTGEILSYLGNLFKCHKISE